MTATGTFQVKLLPMANYVAGEQGISLGRMSIDKQFSGDLTANSKGEMLSALTPVKGSAGYVAIEQVSGSLQGKQGSFVLQHSGIMNQGDKQLQLVVVPDSGSAELTGLTGDMTIDIVDGVHHYRFDYVLP